LEGSSLAAEASEVEANNFTKVPKNEPNGSESMSSATGDLSTLCKESQESYGQTPN